ncbi:MAG: aminopeptidase [Nitrospiraceae bacterium]|nr:MAG: aminopeptidase [Nitrospiraceae bacterium]
MKKDMIQSIDTIYKINLAIRKKEKVLVLTDKKDTKIKKIAEAIYARGSRFTENIKLYVFDTTGYHGTEPPEEAWTAAYGEKAVRELKEKKILQQIIAKKATQSQLQKAEGVIKKYKKESVDAVIALPYYSTSHTRFRDMLNRICRARYASMPLFDEKMLSGAMQVDWLKMKERTQDIARIVNRYEQVEIECPNGSAVRFSKKGRKALMDTGIINKGGQFSNLPAGEVYLAPLEGTARGRLVLDWAPTHKLKQPVTVHVEKGMARAVEGEDRYGKFLQDKFKEKKENRNIAELGIGTNDRATRPDNILESEKIFGTIHIAFGDNSSFGGTVSTSFHQDFVFFQPTLTLISAKGRRRVLLKRGKLVVKD